MFSTRYPRPVNGLRIARKEKDTTMFAMLLIVLFALLGLASAIVLADSGLRWWSAFGRLRRQLDWAGNYALPASLVTRPTTARGGFSGSGRVAMAHPRAARRALRAAA
jgi:hypothetical protein